VKYRSWFLKLAGSAVLLSLALWLLPIGDIWSTLRATRPAVWIGAFFVFLAGHLVTGTKWWLLAVRDEDIPLGRALRAHFTGLAANLGLPGAAGGDVLRAGLLLRQSQRKSRVTLGSILDRVLDTAALLVLSAAGAWLAIDPGSGIAAPLQNLAVILVVCTALTVVAGFTLAFTNLRQIGVVSKALSALAEISHEPGRVLLCFGLSVLVQTVFVGLNIAFAIDGGVHVSTAAWFFAWPLSKLVAMVPVSLGGLGVREASLAAMMAPFGADPAKVFAIGLVWQSILYASGLTGSMVLFFSARLRLSPAGNPQG
jgi:uncharacterized membrane protein YbhN (UPF0104 family)